jgi:predicted ATPase/DNA-binding winged helix-turn-helix (wHTH) protein
MITDGLTASQANGGPHNLRIEREVALAADRAAAPAERAIAFGPFRLLPTRRLLLQDGERVHLGSRALEILLALVERHGQLVSKSELMARVWPDTFVEEGNLKVQVAGLRRALGDSRGTNRYLATIPGRGYRFVAPVSVTDEISAQRAAEAAQELPAPVAAIIDRADSVGAIAAQLAHQRFITIVGPGGIGKTTVALAVARGLIDRYEHGVRFIDLASVTDPRLVPDAFVTGLGLAIGAETSLPGLMAALADKRMLLVLDNCEHVIEAAATLVFGLLNGTPGLQILATSREPLRAESEHVHRLPPLAIPPASPQLTAAEALRFPAVQLFVERAAATSSTFSFGDKEAPLVADVCRRLDGIPLAIELAAARVDALGVWSLALHLDEPLHLLTAGRRAAPPRHHSLRAMLDWGNDLLPEPERIVLRRLAIFTGGFTLEAASAVAAGAKIAQADVVEHVANLVAKSLIAADVTGTAPRYRLLGTTRAYALEKLLESGEFEEVGHCHARWARDRAPRADQERSMRASAERLAACGRLIDKAGALRDWASSRTGSSRLGYPASPLPASFHR